MNNGLKDLIRKMLSLLPDKLYISIAFRKKMKQKMNWKQPKTFNEKLQWLKLYDRRPEYTTMVDKYAAKEYVAKIIGDEYIIPTLGVWECFDDIDFSQLPNQFVLKCTHDSGGLVICRNKDELDVLAAKKKIEESLNVDYYKTWREWPYKNVQPRIIAEKYMEDYSDVCLKDYKFYCFDGEPKFLYLSAGLENHATAHISYVTLDWEKAPYERTDFRPFETLPDKPKNFDMMIKYAKQLSKEIPFSRIDFYEINGKLYFGEITLYPGSGYAPFKPKEWDEIIGEWIKLPQKRKNK